MKILVVHTYGLGDMIMATPAVMKLHECYPDAKIDLLIFQRGSEAPLANAPFLGRVYYSDFSLGGILKSLAALNKNGYDLALHTSGTSIPKISLLMFALKAGTRVGEHGVLKLPWYDFQRRRADGEHRVVSNLKLIEPLCGVVTGGRPRFYLCEESLKFAEKFIKSNALEGKKLVAVHPGCNEKFANKRWEVEKYIELLRKVLDKIENVAVLVVVGPQELAEGEAIKDALPQTVVVHESLQDAAALISMADLMVTNDSGLGHVASCFDVPTLTIFSKKSHADARKIKPFSENSYVVDFREEMVKDEVSALFSQMERVLR